VKLTRSALLLAALPCFAASSGNAQEAHAETSPAQEAQAEAPPTVQSLRDELRQMQARRAREIEQLKEEMAGREDEADVAQEREAAERERLLRIYGFADFGIMRTIAPENGRVASQFTTPLTFYLGRLNLYYDAHPASDFRFLAETRLSLYPNGTTVGVSPTGQVMRTSTQVSDISSPNASASVTWGSIILERAVLDWTRFSLFSVRAGLFLTPFGIYNVDHGSPTLITVALPIYISQGWIPERQLGVQIFGTHPIAPWELGYFATVSNGRSDGILDVGDSKAYGGRVFARRQGELSLALGGSLLYQPYRKNLDQFGLGADGSISYTSTRVVERTGLTLGGDLSVDFRSLRLRSELVMYQVHYTPGRRDVPAGAPSGALSTDTRNVNWSMLLAYRLWKIEPYLFSEMFVCSPTQPTLTEIWAPGVGGNIYLRTNVIIKASWVHPMFWKNGDPQNLASQQNFHTFTAMLVWAF
jgi:hypothetical protein